MTTTHIYSSHQPAHHLYSDAKINSIQSRYSSETVFTNKSSNSTTVTINSNHDPQYHRKDSFASTHTRSHKTASPDDNIVYSIQAFGPTTNNSITCAPISSGRPTGLIDPLDQFPFPPCHTIDSRDRHGTHESIRILRPADGMGMAQALGHDAENHRPLMSTHIASQHVPVVDSIIIASVLVQEPRKRGLGSMLREASPKIAILTIPMPSSSYQRHFAKDADGLYIGTEPYRLWTTEEVEARYGRFRDAAPPPNPGRTRPPETKSATLGANLAPQKESRGMFGLMKRKSHANLSQTTMLHASGRRSSDKSSDTKSVRSLEKKEKQAAAAAAVAASIKEKDSHSSKKKTKAAGKVSLKGGGNLKYGTGDGLYGIKLTDKKVVDSTEEESSAEEDNSEPWGPLETGVLEIGVVIDIEVSSVHIPL